MNTELRSMLLGRWRLDQGDKGAVERYGNTRLEFREDGTLLYTIVGSQKDEIAVLRFRVEGNVLVTDQPSAPREERTQFDIGADDRLFLNDDQGGAHYLRVLAETDV